MYQFYFEHKDRSAGRRSYDVIDLSDHHICAEVFCPRNKVDAQSLCAEFRIYGHPESWQLRPATTLQISQFDDDLIYPVVAVGESSGIESKLAYVGLRQHGSLFNHITSLELASDMLQARAFPCYNNKDGFSMHVYQMADMHTVHQSPFAKLHGSSTQLRPKGLEFEVDHIKNFLPLLLLTCYEAYICQQGYILPQKLPYKVEK